MMERHQWHLMSKAEKMVFLQAYPEEERTALLDSLTFPETDREVHELVEMLYERAMTKRRGSQAEWMNIS